MVKKKRGHPDIDEIMRRPWCYYCERDFDDLKILISHQKAKHFKCERCGRRLNTAGGLSVHMNQVHKESLNTVENALPNRGEANIEIFGMEGIPEDVLTAHQQRVTEVYFRSEAERRAATGNPPPGAKPAAGNAIKKPKVESAEDIKKRLAEHKARKEAEKSALGSGSNTPGHLDHGQAPLAANSPQAASFQAPFVPPQSSMSPPNFNPYQPPPQPGFPGFAGSPINQAPFSMPPNPHLPQRHPSWGPPIGQQPSAGVQNGMPVGYPQGVSPGPYMQHPHATYSPSGPPASAPGMSPGLPQPSPGLPQRPAFQAPNLSKEEMATLHAGAPPPLPIGHYPNGSDIRSSQSMNRQEIGDSVDELIKSVTGETQAPQPPQPVEPMPAAPATAPSAPSKQDVTESLPAPSTPQAEKKDKKAKKSKDDKSATKLVYSDNQTSPEEKMAHNSRYSFDRQAHETTELITDGPSLRGAGDAVTGVDGDTVRDPQDTHPA